MKQVILRKTIQKQQNLDDFLNQYNFSKKQKHLLKMEKRIQVNHKTTQHNIQLYKNDQIEIDCTYQEQIKITPYPQPLEILYEDELVLIVNKPIHFIVHSDGSSAPALTNLVAQYYINTNQQCSIHPIHRLDKDTSGCLLFCKNPFFQPYFDKCMSEKKIKRSYLALAEGKIDKEMTLRQPIGKDRHTNKYRVSKNGTPAITHLKPLEYKNNMTLIECVLETGRTHQIRVHCASIHHPLIGDELYGTKSSMRCALHSYQLTFTHPLLEKTITVCCPLPKDMRLCINLTNRSKLKAEVKHGKNNKAQAGKQLHRNRKVC